MTTETIILAAGKGSRMKSKLPKVLQPLAGKSLLQHVVDSANTLPESLLHIVVGHESERVKQQFAKQSNIQWAEQTEQLGTGHAVQQAAKNLQENSQSLILYGDVPLVKPETLQNLLQQAATSLSLLTVNLQNPTGYGRIVRDSKGSVTAIVEEKDATEAQKAITEVNTGIMAVPSKFLLQLLPKLNNNNAQQEYYLTDVIALAVEAGIDVNSLCIDDADEVQGVNDKRQLAYLERAYQMRQANKLMEQGVTLLDPARIDIRGKVNVGMDVSIDVNCIFQGEVTLGENVIIEANCIIGSPGAIVSIGNNSHIKANSVIEQAEIGESCDIGPYARIRPQTVLANNAKIGNFVETKKTTIGQGSKVNHLSYIGDATVLEKVNIGAGTITCNYDGVNKHQTVIKDEAFIGSNTSLVAPITIGEKSTVGAGSTVNMDVPDNTLTVARGKQRNINGWKRPEKK